MDEPNRPHKASAELAIADIDTMTKSTETSRPLSQTLSSAKPSRFSYQSPGLAPMDTLSEQLRRILAEARAVFASADAANAWLLTPLDGFDGQTPDQLVRAGKVDALFAHLKAMSNA